MVRLCVPTGSDAGRATDAFPVASRLAVPRVFEPSFTVTLPDGVPPAPATVTFTALADPKVEGSGTCTADTVAATPVLHVVTLMLSTNQPTTPPQPSRPMAKRTLIALPFATARAGSDRLMIEVPQSDWVLPPS